jgi:hypothetical protein
MTWLITAKQYIPAVIGEAFGGGYFAGYISHTANGVPTHALIVAPRATGATGSGYTPSVNLQWKTVNTVTTNTASTFDGAANTAAMVAAGIASHPAADFCVNLSINGFADWYLPSSLELDIAYFNLKPSTTLNSTTVGTNAYAVPQRNSNWTAEYPTQTSLTAFNTSLEGFVGGAHWSSTEATATTARSVNFGTGAQVDSSKSTGLRIRAFRRIAL